MFKSKICLCITVYLKIYKNTEIDSGVINYADIVHFTIMLWFQS